MASSFASQIPTIVHLIKSLRPTTMLDVGKGFGKYGFLAHEYVGIPTRERPDPTQTMAQQSELTIDAVEVEPTFLWPHLPHIYRKVYVGKIEDLQLELPDYDLVLMADVIEHIEKSRAEQVLRGFLKRGSKVIIATPRNFFHQDLYDSEFEEHVSHWPPHDMRALAPWVAYQNCGPGRVYLLSSAPVIVRGFGNSLLARGRSEFRVADVSIS